MTRWRQAAGTLVCAVALLLGCRPGTALADVRGMVIRVQGDQVVVNLGLQKGLQPGQKLYVYNALGSPVATVQVSQVDESSSVVQIVSMEPGAALTLGNQVSDAPYSPVPIAARPSETTGGSGVASVSTPATSAVPPASSKLSPDGRPVDAVKAFAAALKTNTQMYAFQGGKGGSVKISAFDVLNFASTLGVGPGGSHGLIINPWLITSTAWDTYSGYQASAKANQRARSYIQVVYWDAALSSAYADYYLFKENVTDPMRRDEMRRTVLAQKGVQTSAVFQVKIRNAGPGALQLQPFDWHCYMIDPQGNRVKAERFDEILDKALNPGQEVDGYIYFPRRDPMGKSYVADPPTLLIEDVFGERAVLKFTKPDGASASSQPSGSGQGATQSRPSSSESW